MKGANTVPFDKSYVAIVHPYVAYDLMQDEKWEEWNKYTNAEAMYEGELGRIGNVRFVESTEAKIWDKNTAGGDVSVFSTLVIGKNAYGVTEVEGGGLQTIVKQLGSGGTADPLNQRASAGWKATRRWKFFLTNHGKNRKQLQLQRSGGELRKGDQPYGYKKRNHSGKHNAYTGGNAEAA